MTTTFPSTDIIDAAEFREQQIAGRTARIIDVRTAGEFESSHIPGSYNIPLATLSEHARNLAAVDHPVVLVCQSGSRASQACEKLTSAGKTSVHVLGGGIASWQANDGDLTYGDTDRWAMERQVRLVAGTITLTGIGLSTLVPGAKWIAGVIGAGLTFSAVSNTCGMGTMLGKLPYNRTDDCDVESVVAELQAS